MSGVAAVAWTSPTWGLRWLSSSSALVHAALTLLLLCRSCLPAAHALTYTTDGCNWTGSGLPHVPSNEVLPVTLRCSEGLVSWSYPYGAIRVTLELPSRTSENRVEFRGCIRPRGGKSRTLDGAFVYVEERRKLRKLLTSEVDRDLRRKLDEEEERMECFRSQGGRAVLFMEADKRANTARNHQAEFEYDLEVVREQTTGDQECRPCSDEEILMEFCSADFVAIGRPHNVYHDYRTGESHVDVIASKIVRQKMPTFTTKSALYKTGRRGRLEGVVRTPVKCGVKARSGSSDEMLLTGAIRLGIARLRCAPSLKEWTSIRERAVQQGSNPCELS